MRTVKSRTKRIGNKITSDRRISVEDSLEAFINNNKKKLEKIYADYRDPLAAAKSKLKNNTDGLPSYFKDYKHAAAKYNETLEHDIDPEGYKLKKAKNDAINKDIWGNNRRLNRKIDKSGFTAKAKSLGTVIEYDELGFQNEFELSLVGYYNVKGSLNNEEYVLAQISKKITDRTAEEYWEYIRRSEVE